MFCILEDHSDGCVNLLRPDWEKQPAFNVLSLTNTRRPESNRGGVN